MAERKPLFMNGTEGFQEEISTSDSITIGGITMGGNISLGGNKVTGSNTAGPFNSGDLVPKDYVDSVAQGLNSKPAALAISVANVGSLSGLAEVIDDITLSEDGYRVLLTGQTNPVDNGLWVIHSGSWTRPTDFAIGSDAHSSFVFVENGTIYSDTGWVCTADSPSDIVGTDDLPWVQFSAAGVITAGSGLSKSGQTLSVKKGDGIEITSNSNATNIDLATDPGLELNGSSPNKKLKALVSSTGGIKIDGASGLAAKLNGSTLLSGASGLSVKGVPSSFELNGTATTYATPGVGQVTATNLDTLTAGSSSNADSLHAHAASVATEAPKVENTLTVGEAISAGDPVYFTNTNNRIGKSDTSDSKAKVIGIARTAQPTPGDTCEVVASGPCAGVLSGATSGNAYYLQTGGGIGTSLPGAGKRVIQVGIAINTTDLFVRILDYGKKSS